MSALLRTVFFDNHIKLGARIVEFSGWEMPIQYSRGIVDEHLQTRKNAGLFDVSHMGRFAISGKNALPFLQHVLTNNAAALDPGRSQYTIIPDNDGSAIDDAYLYRFTEDEYLLVVNASNREKDWNHLEKIRKNFNNIEIKDITNELSMISLQGPLSKKILEKMIDSGTLPEPGRNCLGSIVINGILIQIAQTGYTGEPVCFELFTKSEHSVSIWETLIEEGAVPVGLGARDTLRLEAGLPLYGHELGKDPDGKPIPVFSIGLSPFAVSFSPLKGEFIGRKALLTQAEARRMFRKGNFTDIKNLPRMVKPVAVINKGIARNGDKVFKEDRHIGYITSGTMVPGWKIDGDTLNSSLSDVKETRAIALALLDSNIRKKDEVEIEIRGKRKKGVVVPYHLRSEAPPYAHVINYNNLYTDIQEPSETDTIRKVQTLLKKSIDNTNWRQKECINLIPSEMTGSRLSKLLTVLDPEGRYAEHKSVKAFQDMEVFYYQGAEFIAGVETLLENELRNYLDCQNVETRSISGQMSNAAVFSAMVKYINLGNSKNNPERMRRVMNHNIMKGGHLSSQPMGALCDFVARDPRTERPAVVNFPIQKDNPYKIDISACRDLIEQNKPDLIIFGKSVIIHKEPIMQIRAMVDELSPDSIIMYDMAHVLGLVGPYFQNPFKEGAEIVTGSTHKTFFGTQRGIIAADYSREDLRWPLWEAVKTRIFPGSVSNHHLGTMLGLLMAAYEMNYFKDEYQKKVIDNAKTFARALKATGLDVAGDPLLGFTETHQVIVNVGYGKGYDIAQKLEKNNIITNYQATPDEGGFTAAGALRIGVSEMTRFGMESGDFEKLAQMIYDVVINNSNIKDDVITFRKSFQTMRYCFSEKDFSGITETLYKLI